MREFYGDNRDSGIGGTVLGGNEYVVVVVVVDNDCHTGYRTHL